MDLRVYTKTFLLGVAFVSVSGFFIFVMLFLFLGINGENLSLASISDRSLSNYKPSRNWDVADLNLEATSSIVVEHNLLASDKILFNKNADAKLPIASLTKLMSAVIVLDNYNLDYSTTITKNADAQYQVLQDVALDDSISLKSLLEIMLIASSNKSAYALSEVMGTEKFVDLMNQKARYIGLQDTFFDDPSGLSTKNQSTAKDLARLALYILNNYPEISQITKLSHVEIPGRGRFENTNQVFSYLPDVVISKTGFTNEAKGCMLLVMNNPKNGGKLVYVILGADDRFSAMQNIINWVRSAYIW